MISVNGHEYYLSSNSGKQKTVYKLETVYEPTSVYKTLVKINSYDFPYAIHQLLLGKKIQKSYWEKDEYIKLQKPDKESKITKPYIYKVKGKELYPYNITIDDIVYETWLVI